MNTAFASTPTAVVVLADSDPRSLANIARRQTLKIAERDELGRLLPGSILERAGRPTGHTVQARPFIAIVITDTLDTKMVF